MEVTILNRKHVAESGNKDAISTGKSKGGACTGRYERGCRQT